MNAPLSRAESSALAMEYAEHVFSHMQPRKHCEEESEHATPYEVAQAINRHLFRFDSGDLCEIVGENFDAINDALKDNDLLQVGKLIQDARRTLIAQLANDSLYPAGTKHITAAMVHA